MYPILNKAALLGLTYMEALIVGDKETKHRMETFTPRAELKNAVSYAIIYLTKLNENTPEVEDLSSLELIERTKQILLDRQYNQI